MVRDPTKTLKETRRVDLIIAAEMLRARRNARLFFALVSVAIIAWQGWNQLSLLLPGVIALYAAIPQVNLCFIAAELKRRRSEGERAAPGAPENGTKVCEDSDRDADQIESELSHLRREACRARTEEDKELVRRRLLALSSRVDARQSRTELKVENIRLEMAKDLQVCDPKRYQEDFLPTFDEWMSVEGCSGAKGTVRDSLLILYGEELERRYNRELGGQAWWEETRGCEAEDDSSIQETFDLDSVIARAEAKKGGPLTPQERAEFERMVLEIEEAEKKFAEMQQRGSPVCPSEDT